MDEETTLFEEPLTGRTLLDAHDDSDDSGWSKDSDKDKDGKDKDKNWNNDNNKKWDNNDAWDNNRGWDNNDHVCLFITSHHQSHFVYCAKLAWMGMAK